MDKEYITKTLTGQPLPFKVAKIEEDNPIRVALNRYKEGESILENLVLIESFRIDALKRMKEKEGDEKNDAASALAVLNNKRSEAKRRAIQYLENAIKQIKSV